MAKKSLARRERVRVALIGCGTAGVQRAEYIVNDLSDQATLVVACDVNEDAARRAKESLGIKDHCKDYREVMDRKDVDAVLIAIPPGLHRDVTVAAAQSGKHVFCEKPMAVELYHADEMIAACVQANVRLMIGYQFRYSKNRAILRELLKQGTIGRPVMWREMLPLYPEAMSQKWLWNYELGGGSLFEYSHSIDFACYTFGQVELVWAQLFSFREDDGTKARDSYCVNIKFESGDVYHISGFGMLPMGMDPSTSFGGSYRLYMDDIVGNRGAIYVGPDEEGKVSMVVAEHVGSKQQKLTTPHWGSWFGGTDADDVPVVAMFANFFDSISTGEETRNSGPEARRTLAVIQAALESSTTGKAIFLSGG